MISFSCFRKNLCCLLLSIASSAHANVAKEIAADRRVFAEHMATRIASDIQSQPNRSVQVGVLPFGDANRRSTAALGNIPLELQCEMIRGLHQFVKAGIQVPSARTVADLINSGSGSVLDLMVDDLGRQRFLDLVGLDYVVWGEIQLRVPSDLLADAGKAIEIKLFMASRLSSRLQTYSGWIDKGDFAELHPATGPSLSPSRSELAPISPPHSDHPRFMVEILDATGAPLAMQFVADANSEFQNSLYLELPSSLKETPYSIRVSDRGGQSVGVRSKENDALRLHQVVVKVDGVGSIWPRGEHGYEPFAAHPFYSHKWVLTPPGTMLVADPTQSASDLRGARLATAEGGDGSVLQIDGFQAGPQTAHEFVFSSDPRDSLAFTRGIGSNDIGLITVHIYAQQFSELDQSQNYFFNLYHRLSFFGVIKNGAAPSSGMASTKLGRQIESPTFTVDFDIVTQPVQVWRIFYRYSDRPLVEPSGQIALVRPLSIPLP
ncbi:MAG: hypothetical protein KDB22_23875 [Planctomycetales bacterium]|nr:hypothetical protein [Planctomycetales bacterium]